MRTSALWLALLVVVAAVAPASALALDASQTAALGDSAPVPQVDEGSDATQPRTTVDISLRSDRSASWRVETHYALDSENETRAFETLARQYEAGEANAGPDIVLFRSLADRASESTGRPMAIENVTYHSSIDAADDRGTLALTFRWTNFLRRGDNETLVLDDVFALPTAESDDQKTWLSIFDADQEILIRPPDGYTVTGTSIPVQQRESAIVLAEPSDFEGETSELRVTYTAIGPAGALPIGLLAGGGFAALVILLAGAWVLRGREESGRTLPWEDPTASDDRSSVASGAVAGPNGGDSGPSPNGRPENGESASEPEAAAAVGGAASGAAVSADDAESSVESEVDLSLLSDEERVEHLLEQNGGRMKQATIVDETGWSDAKVSQLLSAMADEDRVDKLRLGRENLISLPDDTGDEEGGDGGSPGSTGVPGDGT
ncbi:hypothetical protein D3D02_02680 [Halobellus sp. Atlit-38R]|uniref:helix-turn-helix transcriptional regulator n=1 Tax=Halobellus sp. Atlit-38R TaxID=2282131 RepID=UPI000EF21002|nr:hypothetical protein [Halobellus sp. Atlit-38R]RLM90696.1 hypothetical protein D3D02_02680 [Halobellus sp. Atlit-38R]